MAAVPQLLVDVGIFFGVLATVAGVIVAVAKSRPARWLWRRLVSGPATEWLKTNMREVVDPIEKRVWGIEHQVHPNGGSSMPDRIRGIDDRCDAIEARQVTMEQKLDRLLERPSPRRWPWPGG